MVDSVRLFTIIKGLKWKHFCQDEWDRKKTNDGKDKLQHTYRNVTIDYYPDKGRLVIDGKILKLLHNTLVSNVDDIYGADLERFLDELNVYLNDLFTVELCLDIRNFEVTRLDVCFNVKPERGSVEQYIDFFNEASKRTDKKGGLVNHTLLCDLEGSAYIKTRGNYARDEKRGYTVNFYSKYDWLRKQHSVPHEDWDRARDVLRLEIQCGDVFIKNVICKKLKIGRTFGELLDYGVAFWVEEWVYGRVFGDCNEKHGYYSIDAARDLIPKRRRAPREILEKVAEGKQHFEAAEKTQLGVLKKEFSIFPYYLLPRAWKYDTLENPLQLIRKKIKDLGIDI